MSKIGMLGVGSFAMALAHLLGHKGEEILMWSHDPSIAESINKTHKNNHFLTEMTLPTHVHSTTSLDETIKDCAYLISVIPSQFIRPVIGEIASKIGDDVIIINGAKGIENDTLKTISEIFEELFPKRLHSQLAYISGPSFAAELAQKQITAVAVASHSENTAQKVKDLLTTSYFKVLTTKDVIGIELCGSLKNIIAIAAGIVDGLNLGANTQAALITGGLTEIRRIGIQKGANITTFHGLAGVGDLVLTCTGDLSRNRFVGRELAKGKKISQILNNMEMVAEGVKTTLSAYQLAQKLGVKIPIITEIYKIIYEDKEPQKAVSDLMTLDFQSDLSSNLLPNL